MTERVHSLTVVLKKPMREDDVQVLIDAIHLFLGVASVGKNIADSSHFSSMETAKFALREQLWQVLK